MKRAHTQSHRGLVWLEVLLFVAMVSTLAAAVLLPIYTCPKRWERSGMQAEFTWGAGCMVQRKDGTWVPEKSLRDVSL